MIKSRLQSARMRTPSTSRVPDQSRTASRTVMMSVWRLAGSQISALPTGETLLGGYGICECAQRYTSAERVYSSTNSANDIIALVIKRIAKRAQSVLCV